MNKESLNSILKSIKTAIMTSRPAYKDFIYKKEYDEVVEIVNTTITEGWYYAELSDKTVTKFVEGEEYTVSIDSTEYKVIANSEGALVIDDIGFSFDIYNGVFSSINDPSDFIGKTISVKYTKHVVEEKYDIKKLPEECLPDSIDKFKKSVQKQNTNFEQQLDNLESYANSIWSYCDSAHTKVSTAQTTANTAQTTANTAQTTANTALTRAKVIPDMFASEDEDAYIANKLCSLNALDKTGVVYSVNGIGVNGGSNPSTDYNKIMKLSNTHYAVLNITYKTETKFTNGYIIEFNLNDDEMDAYFPDQTIVLDDNLKLVLKQLNIHYNINDKRYGYETAKCSVIYNDGTLASDEKDNVSIYITTYPISNIQKLNGDLVTTASSEIMGTVKANAKTEDQTLPVGIDDSGFLWTKETDIPTVTSDDNGKILRVVDGVWAAVTIPNANEVSF